MMTRNRLDRLERQMRLNGGKQKLVVISSYGSTDDEINAVLRGAGLAQDGKRDRNTVVHLMKFVTIYEDRDGHPMPPHRPPEILFVGGVK